jgi:predicted  nucleic acid-binding Zn-ribbon protein
MSDTPQNESMNPVVRNILLALSGIFIVASLAFLVMAFNRISDLQQQQQKQASTEEDLAKKIERMDSNFAQNRASVNALAQKMGVTRQELARKSEALQKEEKEIASRVAAGEEANKQQFGAVNGELSGVKGDVGKVKDDVSATQNDLAATKAKLEHAIGDLNKETELIATTHDELEVLKHKGDRNYFEFTLTKGKQVTHVATVGLQLKNVDPGKSKFTIYVMADDKKIEKKDKTVNEPLQFYTGKDHNLYEVVVNTLNKKTVTGYLVTPKNVNLGLQGADQQSRTN